MQVESPGIDHMVPESNPGRPQQHTRGREAIPQGRCFQVEAAWYLFHCIGHCAVIKSAGAAADQIGLVAVLVDGMGGLRRCGGVENDLEDDVDPSTVDGSYYEGGVIGIRVGGGVGVEEEGRLVVGISIVQAAATQRPIVICAKAAEFEDVGGVGGRRGLIGGIRN